MDRVWPAGLRIKDIGWTVRTRNLLGRKGWLQEDKLTSLTFRDLFTIDGMGTVTVLDFCSTLEGAIDFFDHLASNYARVRINNENSDQSASEDPDLDLVATLEQTLAEDWAAQISEQDPRFAALIPPGTGTLQERIEKLLSINDAVVSVVDAPLLNEAMIRIKKQIEEIKQQPLESSLAEFLEMSSKTKGERLQILLARLGWNGEPPLSLEECGRKLGLTRERIRQIQSDVVGRFPDHEVFMPNIDKAITLLEKMAPLSLDNASSVLKREGISSTAFYLPSLLNSATLLGKKTSLQICETRTGKTLVNNSDAKTVQLIPSLARKLAGRSGATSVYQLQDVLIEEGHEINEDNLRAILHSNINLDFLDDDWFWAMDVKDGRNRLMNTVKKILSVASPQPIQSIREGVRRSYSRRGKSPSKNIMIVLPPIDIMKAFLKKQKEFRVEDEMVFSKVPLNYARELGDSARIMVEVLRSAPAGVLDRTSFAEGCLARGMNENTFNLYTTYSCIIEHPSLGIWKLRGVLVDPAAVEAVRQANHLKPKEKRVLEFGWTSDSKLWIAARVPRIGRNAMIIGCPGDIQRYLIGQEFKSLVKERGVSCGTIVINERGTSYGYGTFIRRYGLDENDILLAEFDLSKNEVLLSVYHEDLFEESF